MQEIFCKLCSLVNVEKLQADREREKKEERKNMLLATKIKMNKEDTGNFQLMSSKLINRTKRIQNKKKKNETSVPSKSPLQKSKSVNNFLSLPSKEDDVWSTAGSDCSSSSEILHEPGARTRNRSGRMSLDSGVSLECPSLSLAWELKDPDRDCSNFDPVARANELFEALDVNGDGAVTEDEFINGCLKDEVFIMLLEKFSGSDIWGL